MEISNEVVKETHQTNVEMDTDLRYKNGKLYWKDTLCHCGHPSRINSRNDIYQFYCISPTSFHIPTGLLKPIPTVALPSSCHPHRRLDGCETLGNIHLQTSFDEVLAAWHFGGFWGEGIL